MQYIDAPYHLLLPAALAAGLLLLLWLKRRRWSQTHPWTFYGSITFLGIYLLIVGGAAYTDIMLQLDLRRFDLNGDGFFSGAEITPAQEAALRKLTADTGRTFSVFTGLVFSAIATPVLLGLGKTMQLLTRKISRASS